MTAPKNTATPAADSLESIKAAEIAKAAEFTERLDGLASQIKTATEQCQTIAGQKAMVDVRCRILAAETLEKLRAKKADPKAKAKG